MLRGKALVIGIFFPVVRILHFADAKGQVIDAKVDAVAIAGLGIVDARPGVVPLKTCRS